MAAADKAKEAEVQAQMDAFRALDAEKQKMMVSRQQFLGQLHENQYVKECAAACAVRRSLRHQPT